MFKIFKPVNAETIAREGIRQLAKEKPVVFAPITAKLLSFVSRFSPRGLTRRVTATINGKRSQ